MGFNISELIKLRKELTSLYNENNYFEALIAGEKILKIYESNNDEKDIAFAEDIFTVALVYDEMGSFEAALGLYKKALSVAKKHYKENSVIYSKYLNNVAITNTKLHKYKEAEKDFLKILEINETKKGKISKEYISTCYNLGNLYEDSSNLKKAVKYHKKALESAQKIEDFNVCEYVDILNACASCYSKMGAYRDSKEYYKTALDTIRKNERECGFFEFQTLLSLSSVCSLSRDYKGAVSALKGATDLRNKIMDKSHIDYITNLNSLAAMYMKAKMYNEAIDVYEEAKPIVISILGKDHIYYTDLLNNIAVAYANMEEYDIALKYAKEAIDIKKEPSEESHFKYSNSVIALSVIYRKMGNYEEAIKVHERAIKLRGDSIISKVYNIDTYISMAKTYSEMKNYDKAILYYKKSLEIRKEIMPEKDDTYAASLRNIAEIYEKKRDYKSALETVKEAASVYKSIYGEEHPKYAEILGLMAKIQLKMDYIPTAIKSINDALNTIEKCYGKENDVYKDFALTKALIYSEMGDKFTAINMYKEVLSLFEASLTEEEEFKIKCKYYKTEASVRNCKNAIPKYKELIEYTKENEKFQDYTLALQTELLGIYSKLFEDDNFNALSDEIMKTTKNKNSKDYGSFLQEYGNGIILKDFEKGETVLKSAVDIYTTLYGKNYNTVYDIYYNLSLSAFKIEKFDKAIEYAKYAVNNTDYKKYLCMYFQLGICYYRYVKDNETARKYFADTALFYEETTLTYSEIYSDSLFMMAKIDEENKNFENAAKLYEKYLSTKTVKEPKIPKDDYKLPQKDDIETIVLNYKNLPFYDFPMKAVKYIDIKIQIARLYERAGLKEEMIRVYKEASEKATELNMRNDQRGIVYLLMCKSFIQVKDYESSRIYYNVAKDYVMAIKETDKEYYINGLLEIADILYDEGFLMAAKEIYENLYSEGKMKKGKSFENLINIYKKNKDYKNYFKLKYLNRF